MAAVDQDLGLFVRDALAKGASRSEIAAALHQAGWAEGAVRAALARFAEVPFPVPVPRPQPYVSARDAFLYLLLFAALAMTAYRLGSLLFAIIDLSLPDPAAPSWGAEWEIRWSISTLVIAFPLYLFLARKLSREVKAEPERRDSRVRKWLTYLTLFLAAVVVLGDVVALVYAFLSGALSLRVGLKILVIAAIAGSIFFFYLGDARADEREAL